MKDFLKGIKWFIGTLTFSRGMGDLGGEFLLGIIHWIYVITILSCLSIIGLGCYFEW